MKKIVERVVFHVTHAATKIKLFYREHVAVELILTLLLSSKNVKHAQFLAVIALLGCLMSFYNEITDPNGLSQSTGRILGAASTLCPTWRECVQVDAWLASTCRDRSR